MTTLEDKIRACIERHPDRKDHLIAKNIRGASSGLVAAIRGGKPLVPAPAAVPASVISFDAIRSRLDTAAAIKRELAKVPPKSFIHEADLCTLTAGRDRNRFRRCVENNAELFAARRIKVKLSDTDSEGKWIWGSEADIAAIKELIER